ncbi:MAG: hypothetical protein ACI86H_000129 [bacterium]|jgi:hypothetical protein
MPPQAKETIQVQVVNADMAIERQSILRDALKEKFVEFNEKNKKVNRDLIYIINSENKPLSNVLLANRDADVAFTCFNIDRKTQTRKRKELILDDNQSDELDIDPLLRFPAILEMQKMVGRGAFKQRRLFLVGDIQERLEHFLKLGFDIIVTVFKNAERSVISNPIRLTSIEQIKSSSNDLKKGQIDFNTVNTLSIADILFHGILDMIEEGNRFFIRNYDTLDDIIKKIFELEGVKEALAREAVEEEKKVFVRRKKVMLVLNPDLRRVVYERLSFDKMERIFEFDSKAEALEALSTGKAKGIVSHLEEEGYDIINTALDQEERDLILVSSIGDQFHGYLEKEMKTQGEHLKLLPEEFISDLFNGLPEKYVDTLLSSLQGKSFDSFLALVPPEIRETVILEFLKNRKLAISGWKEFNPADRKGILKQNLVDVLATLNLVYTPLFKKKFPDITFEMGKGYDSTTGFKKLSHDEQNFYLDIFRKGLKGKKFPANMWSEKFTQEEFDHIITAYIILNSNEFYNSLTAVLRKQLWVTVAGLYQEQINKKLHFMDKVKIMNGNREAILVAIKTHADELLKLFRGGYKPKVAHQLFLGLKRFNKVESKTALLKRIVSTADFKKPRMEGLEVLLSSKAGVSIYQKLTSEIDALSQGYDSLICMSADVEELKIYDELKDATVVLVDEEVDATLLEMFQNKDIDWDNYEKFAAEIEEKIAKLRKELELQGKNDPVAAYLIESMIVLLEMSSQAARNQLNSGMIDSLDERSAIRERIIQGMEENLKEIAERLEHTKKEILDLENQLKENAEKLEKYSEQVNERKEQLLKSLHLIKKNKASLGKALHQKKRIAMLQKNLSLEFFKIIKPLVLGQLRQLPAPIEAFIRAFKNQFFTEEELQKRVIFKFTDEEIRKIMKHKFVFSTDNELLKQFIVTCLDIDHLENTLFRISGSKNIPDEPDVIFIGPELNVAQFKDYLDEKYIVPFADKKFFMALMKNEKQKKLTKVVLVKLAKEGRLFKAQAEKIGAATKGMLRNQKMMTVRVRDMGKIQKNLVQSIGNDEETRHFLTSEKETLNEKLNQIDEKFEGIKTDISGTIAEGGSAVAALEKSAEDMGKNVAEKLMAISEELGGMMFIKNVKDAGSKISNKTQERIIEKIDQVSRYTKGKAGLKELVIAHDGSLDSQNLRRVLGSVVTKHFGVHESTIVDLSFSRLENNIVEGGRPYSFIILIGDDRTAKLKNYVQSLKNIRAHQPESYILLFTPYGKVGEKKNEDLLENTHTLNEQCLMVNTEIVDYTSVNRLNRFFREFAPA